MMRMLLLLDVTLMMVHSHRVVFAETGRGAVMAGQEVVILDVKVGGAGLHMERSHVWIGSCGVMVYVLNLLHRRDVHLRHIGNVLYFSGGLFNVLHLLIAHVRRAHLLAHTPMQLLSTAYSLTTYAHLRHKVTD